MLADLTVPLSPFPWKTHEELNDSGLTDFLKFDDHDFHELFSMDMFPIEIPFSQTPSSLVSQQLQWRTKSIEKTQTRPMPVFTPVSPICGSANICSARSKTTAKNIPVPVAATSASALPNLPEGVADLPPFRALSAYNFFFRDERDRILHGGECEWTKEKQQQLLEAHWNQDRIKKRRHRKTHGKINFNTLTKLVSQRWKELDKDQKKFYQEVAKQDFDRYQREMREYKKRTDSPTATQP